MCSWGFVNTHKYYTISHSVRLFRIHTLTFVAHERIVIDIKGAKRECSHCHKGETIMTIKNDNAKAIGILIAIIALIVASIVASIFSITAMNLVVIALLGYGTFVSLFVVTADITDNMQHSRSQE